MSITFIEAIEKDYQETISQGDDYKMSKLAYVGNYIFGFTTYDYRMDEKLALKMTEVLKALIIGNPWQYHELNDDNYQNYILMCNSPFLKNNLEWGTSIHGAWVAANNDIDHPFDVPKEHFKKYCEDIIKWVETR